MTLDFPGREGHVKTPDEARAFELCTRWNERHGADMDVDGELEHELEALGFVTRRKNGKPRRNLDWTDSDGWLDFFRSNSNYAP